MKSILSLCIALLAFSGLYAQTTAQNNAPDDKVFVVVQQQPVFPGNFNQWLAQHIVYPPDAMKNNIEGTVYVSFIVEKDGSVTSIKVLRGVDTLLDNESLRVVALMPKWTPGMQNGKAVRVQYMVPVRFTLNNSAPASQKN